MITEIMIVMIVITLMMTMMTIIMMASANKFTKEQKVQYSTVQLTTPSESALNPLQLTLTS